jgi:hypothetical protein
MAAILACMRNGPVLRYVNDWRTPSITGAWAGVCDLTLDTAPPANKTSVSDTARMVVVGMRRLYEAGLAFSGRR